MNDIYSIDEYGIKRWYRNGLLHRENGPAVEYPTGSQCWWFNGKLHRIDGPAIKDSIGYDAWWLHGQRIDCSSQEEFERLIKLKAFW